MDLMIILKRKDDTDTVFINASKSCNSYTDHPNFIEYKKIKGREIKSFLRKFKKGYEGYRSLIKRFAGEPKDLEYIQCYFG